MSGVLFADPIGIDTFEDGTTQGWARPGPHPAPPVNITSGGPGGAGDNYLQVTALGGSDAGSRLSVQNLSQWTGSFSSLSGISMDVNNFGPDQLFLRLLFVNFSGAPGMSPPSDVAWTLAPVIVPAGSGWHPVLFNLSPANIFAPLGSVSGALSGVDELRLFHNPVPAFGGPGMGAPPVTAVLGVDNIAPVPEPSTMLLLGAGLAVIGLRLLRPFSTMSKSNPQPEGVCEERQWRGCRYSTSSPQNILAAVIANRIEPITAARRTQPGNSLGTPVSSSAQDHKAVPAPKDGPWAREVAVPTSMTPDAIANTRNPPAIISFPFLKNFKVRTWWPPRAAPSIPHKAA